MNLDFINKAVKNSSGKYLVNNTLILEWEKISAADPEFNAKIKKFTSILVPTYVQQELEFARKFPAQVPHEFFLKSVAPLFEHGEKIDWDIVERKIDESIEQFFRSTDFSKFSKLDDIFILVIAKDKITGKVLGILQFQASPEFNFGNIRIGYFGIVPDQNSHVKELLISSMFKLVPETERIFLHTRISNQDLISFYENLGFKRFAGQLPNWIDLEYISKDSNKLQNISAQLD